MVTIDEKFALLGLTEDSARSSRWSKMRIVLRKKCNRAVLCLAVLVGLGDLTTPSPAQTAAIAVEHVGVLTMTGQPRLTNQTVVIDGGRVHALGPAGTVRIPRGARRVNGAGATLLPGLWDSHVHLLTAGDSSVSRVELAERFYFPAYVANGVTAVLDLGAPIEPLLELRAHLRDTGVHGPRLYSVGQLLGGNNPYAPDVPWNREVKDSLDALAAVEELRAIGVDYVKVHDFLPRGVWAVIASRARDLGLRVTGHLSPSVSVFEAVAAGQLSIQHVGPELLAMCTDSSKVRIGRFYDTWIRDGASAFADGSVALWRDRDSTSCDSALRELGVRGLAITPTMVHRFVDRAADRAGEGLQTRAAKAQCSANLDYWMSVPEASRLRYRETIQAFVRTAHRAGVRIIAGTDGPGVCLPAGTALVLELEEMVAAGLTPLQAIASATVDAATAVGADSLGTIAPGQLADVILVGGDPSRDIRTLRRIQAVIERGTFFDRQTLDAMTRAARAYDP